LTRWKRRKSFADGKISLDYPSMLWYSLGIRQHNEKGDDMENSSEGDLRRIRELETRIYRLNIEIRSLENEKMKHMEELDRLTDRGDKFSLIIRGVAHEPRF
jgi:predicted RNase H-like nuclease (RuvC/YqgF family)